MAFAIAIACMGACDMLVCAVTVSLISSAPRAEVRERAPDMSPEARCGVCAAE